jgi:hypothetical protein
LSERSQILLMNVVPPSGTASYAGTLSGMPPFLSLVAQSVALTPANDIVIGVPARFVWD